MSASAGSNEGAIPVLVGPFPQAAFRGGVSATNAKLAEMLAARGLAYECIDLGSGRRSKSLAYHLSRLVAALSGFAKILFAPAGRMRCYEISIDGGGGIAYNILLASAARLRRAPMLFYHHSTQYVLADSLLMKMLLRVGGPQTSHVVCSRRMFDMFRERYRVPDKVLILSNAAWISPSPVPQSAPADDRIVLGYIGGLTEGKGVLRALETLEALKRRGLPARIVIAGGGMTEAVRAAIEAAKARFGADVVFLGSISDDEKWRFFAGLDYFLFPTLHPHETQSSVAPEAMSAGVPVVAYDHRFVGEMVGEEGGLLIPTAAHFATVAADWIAGEPGVAARRERRDRARRHYERLYAEAVGRIEMLIARMLKPE